MRDHQRLVIINRTKGRRPRLPFVRIQKAVCGPSYTLELVFVGRAESRVLNLRYRGKKKPANVLSFRLSGKSGQIIICPAEAKTQSSIYGMTERGFIAYLFIHGLLHLEGYRHGSKMESKEQRLCDTFSVR